MVKLEINTHRLTSRTPAISGDNMEYKNPVLECWSWSYAGAILKQLWCGMLFDSVAAQQKALMYVDAASVPEHSIDDVTGSRHNGHKTFLCRPVPLAQNLTLVCRVVSKLSTAHLATEIIVLVACGSETAAPSVVLVLSHEYCFDNIETVISAGQRLNLFYQ
jgi:hypothetical protein